MSREVDLSFAAELAATPGPYATAYLDVSRDHENAPHEIELRWRELRQQLLEQGADADTVGAMDDAMTDTPAVPGGAGRCLVARGGQIRFDRPLPTRPRTLEARWAPLPHLWPYLAQLPRIVPYVLAVVDRTGADLYAFEQAPDGLLRAAEDEVVAGGERPIAKVPVGGWSQRRYQQRAENLWQSNARQMATETERLVKEVHAGLLIIAGDARERAALAEELPSRSREVLVETEAGGRSLGASDDALADSVAQLVDERYTAQLSATVDAFCNQQAADGMAATIRALREHRVHTLLVRDDPNDERMLSIGPESDQLAHSADELTALGVEHPMSDRADAALVRAAAASRAHLLVLSPDRGEPDLGVGPRPDAPQLRLRDGIGFLARY